MATRAEWFRYNQERSGPKRAPRSNEVPERVPGSARAAKNAVYEREVSVGQPSRKSTRKSANHAKTDMQMRMKARNAEVRPESRSRAPH
jgi:hypothetical protein